MGVPACQLPGGKQERGELPSETMERMFQNRLKPLAGHVQGQRMEREVTWKESKEYRMRTKYLRTVCYSIVVEPFKVETLRINLNRNSENSSRSPEQAPPSSATQDLEVPD